MDTKQMTTADFANAIRTKYASGVSSDGRAYKDIPDDELVEKIVAKYPVYKTQISDYQAEPSLFSKYTEGVRKEVSTLPGRLAEDVQAGAKDLAESQKTGSPLTALKGIAKAGLRTAEDVAGAIYSPVAGAVGIAAEKAGEIFPEAKQTIETGIKNVADIISEHPAVQEFAMKHPEAEKDFQRVLNLMMAGGEKGKIEPATMLERTTGQVKTGLETVKTGAEDLYKAITSKSPEQVDAFITKNFEKGVKPTVTGKGTLGQVEKYKQNAIDAVKTIVENKPKLNIVDEFGESTGSLPKSLKEFTQAIDQTKKVIFDQYDAMAKAAGEKGAVVDLKPIANELKIIEGDTVMQDLHPDIVNYANTRAKALESRGQYTTADTQRAIEIFNKSLEAFYKNPSYETASKAAVDAMIANKLRISLDDAIEGLQGEGYQALKNKYGSLKAIEKDVVKRSIVDARKNAKGLIDFTDVVSGSELLKGLATMDPGSFATAAGIKGISAYIKYLNDPNTSIAKLFSGVEKYTKTTAPKESIQSVPLQKGTVSPTKVETNVPSTENITSTEKVNTKDINMQKGVIINPFSEKIPREIENTLAEFKNMPKGTHIERPNEFVPTPYKISDTVKEITGAQGKISFTRRSLKHLSEKGSEGERLIKIVPEILKNPDEIRQGDLDNRYLISKSIKDVKNGRPQVVNLEVTEKNGDIVVTSFQSDADYLSDYELLWRTGVSNDTFPPSNPALK